MRVQVRRPMKVLAVFEDGKPPMPCKYKIKDETGIEETVSIHKITSVDSTALSFVAYECETYYENAVKRYDLIYWKQELKWELFVK